MPEYKKDNNGKLILEGKEFYNFRVKLRVALYFMTQSGLEDLQSIIKNLNKIEESSDLDVLNLRALTSSSIGIFEPTYKVGIGTQYRIKYVNIIKSILLNLMSLENGDLELVNSFSEATIFREDGVFLSDTYIFNRFMKAFLYSGSLPDDFPIVFDLSTVKDTDGRFYIDFLNRMLKYEILEINEKEGSLGINEKFLSFAKLVFELVSNDAPVKGFSLKKIKKFLNEVCLNRDEAIEAEM